MLDDPGVGADVVAEFADRYADMPAAFVRALVTATDTLAEGQDAEAILERLLDSTCQLLPGSDVSASLGDDGGGLSLIAGSTERKRFFETYQIENSTGPSVDCFRDGVANAYELTEGGDYPWPEVARLARVVGYRSIRTIPLRLREETLGVLSVADQEPYPASPLQSIFLQALVDSTTIGLVNQRLYRASLVLSRQLQGALTTRVLIEQSKGAVAARLDISVDDAFRLLRNYARSTNRRLNDVAKSVLDGSISTEQLWSRSRG